MSRPPFPHEVEVGVEREVSSGQPGASRRVGEVAYLLSIGPAVAVDHAILTAVEVHVAREAGESSAVVGLDPLDSKDGEVAHGRFFIAGSVPVQSRQRQSVAAFP